MVEERQQPSAEEPEAEAPEVSGASAPEDIEAYWRNRISGTDKKRVAAEAEARVLREQLATAQAKPVEAGKSGGDAPEMAELAQRLQKELELERAGRVMDARKSKYPAASQALGDEVLAQVDEARLAALDASLAVDVRTPRPVDLNNPARSRPAGPKPLDDMTIEELRAHLRTQVVPGQR